MLRQKLSSIAFLGAAGWSKRAALLQRDRERDRSLLLLGRDRREVARSLPESDRGHALLTRRVEPRDLSHQLVASPIQVGEHIGSGQRGHLASITGPVDPPLTEGPRVRVCKAPAGSSFDPDEVPCLGHPRLWSAARPRGPTSARSGGSGRRDCDCDPARLPTAVCELARDGVPMTAPTDPLALLRSRSYVALLILAAIVGVPVSAAAYFFLALVSKLQGWVFTTLPHDLGFHAEPLWWPILPLALAGVLVSLTIHYLPGNGGNSPADGFKTGEGPPIPRDLPGVVLAAFATLSLGVVLGPEAPMIALGGGLGVIAVRLVKRDAPPRTLTVVAPAGSFAAISTLFGSPLLGAFLMMEVSGLAGAMMELVLLPGLLAAGVGSLIFVGLDAWTGLGTFSLAVPNLPYVGSPTGGEIVWAVVIGVLAAPLASAIRWLGFLLQPQVERRRLQLTPVLGLAVAGLAIAFAAGTNKGSSDVLFSGQSALGPFISNSASYTVGALLLLMICKGLAYGISLSAFRGGPTFPAMFLGAVGGVALSHLPGLPVVDGVAMGIGAMTVVMLRLPLTSVLLATVLLASDALQVMPLVIVAVVVAYVVSARLTPTSRTVAAAPPSTPSSGPAAHPVPSDA